MRANSTLALCAALVCIVFFAGGCSDTPLESTTATSASGDAEGLATPMYTADMLDDAEVIAAVVGNNHTNEGDFRRTATFEMYEFADGTVSGWYHALRRGPGGANIRVDIECLHVVGNEAWAKGSVVSAANPDNVGRPYSFHFIDNGQGANCDPDEIGVGRFVDSNCESEPELEMRQLTIGNLKVVE